VISLRRLSSLNSLSFYLTVNLTLQKQSKITKKTPLVALRQGKISEKYRLRMVNELLSQVISALRLKAGVFLM
jgi:hypothetical protein